jgi:signal transduction histidine kinase
VLLLDPPAAAIEDLTAATMLGRQISLTIETCQLHAERRLVATSRERTRLARDLHDGVLQFLAGSRLQLDLIGRTKLSEEARDRVQQMRIAIAEEQRQLRATIRTMHKGPEHGSNRLADALTQVAEHLARSWNVEISAEVTPVDLEVSDEMEDDVVRIAREAVANAVRHGAARHVTMQVTRADDRLTMVIGDDGRGFPFEGEMTHDDLRAFAGRPRSLYARVAAMEGGLTLSSAPSGARITISVPMQAEH